MVEGIQYGGGMYGGGYSVWRRHVWWRVFSMEEAYHQ